ncbi:hypothetical protein THIAE_06130 [Thiomicrospira aerophila AL3]|uniref:Conjugal transfer protein n=1 Tax=Thiomicrospira aerophila AL3 TaxID=717772 RepID=W0DYF8_9GAMM|nr:TIGR03750 family conjugal transfer protein [Thiomicrospira aerophila]AHF02293.1 hypothetical protein THIAE_06130 [Thiomicrospira aerophila AL3]
MAHLPETDLVAAVLDRDPRVIKGATMDELLMLVKFFGGSGFVTGLIIGLIFVPSYALIPAIVITLISLGLGVWMGSVSLLTIKRDKPQGYVLQWISIKLSQKASGLKPKFIYGARHFSINRKPFTQNK